MLLSKGLRFNTYQQMQPIRASANQSRVSLLHTPAGADECRKVSPYRERPNPNIHEIICWLHLSTHTYVAEHPCPVHAPLPTGMSGTAWQMCPPRSQHACSSAPRKLQPWDHLKHHPHRVGMSFCLWRGTTGGEFPGHRDFASGVLGGTHWNCSRWDASFPTLSNPPRFYKQHKASALQPEVGAQLLEVTPSLKQPVQFLMSVTMAKVSQPAENSPCQQPCGEPARALRCCYKCQSSPAQWQLGHTSMRHCRPSVSTRAIQVSGEMVATHSLHEKRCVAHVVLE